ncbi:protein takeout [Halyomorpha halys]|uniref:protein takeout n=1 Tax=Halyomorpha halys TaxID=286706 RepID=UPI0006D4F581|nr:protein takeout-like [Halyomorpha halys]
MLVPLLFLCLSPLLICSLSLPGGIKKCKNDKTLNDCIQKQSKAVTNALSKGDPKFGIPVVDPLFVPKIEQTQGGGTKSISLNLTLENINIFGFSKSEIVKTDFDTSKKFLSLTFKVPKLKLVADYNMNGKFLVIPITGQGKVTVIMDNVEVVSTVIYKLEKKKGAEYAVFDPNPRLTYTTTKANYNLENLFNGDKALGDATNKMLNENWKEFTDAMGPGIAGGIGKVYGLVLSKMTSSMPFKELFL